MRARQEPVSSLKFRDDGWYTCGWEQWNKWQKSRIVCIWNTSSAGHKPRWVTIFGIMMRIYLFWIYLRNCILLAAELGADCSSEYEVQLHGGVLYDSTSAAKYKLLGTPWNWIMFLAGTAIVAGWPSWTLKLRKAELSDKRNQRV